ncbi:MAG: hypothetical protein AAGC67_21050 [Myxococcota bacterium]
MPATRAGAAGTRLGNVEAALFAGGADASAAERTLAGCFVTVRSSAGGSDLAGWVERLEAATEERILIVEGADGAAALEVELDVVQALLCWPEADALFIDETDRPRLTLLRPEATLDSARRHAAGGADRPSAWLAAFGAERVDPARLGLEPRGGR